MTDEQDKQPNEAQEFGDEIEQFEFDDSDFDAEHMDASQGGSDTLPPSLPPAHPRSKLPLIVGVVIGVFIFYKIVSFVMGPHKSASTAKNLDDAPVTMPTPKNTTQPALSDLSIKPTTSLESHPDEASAFLSEANQLSNAEATPQNTMNTTPVALPPPAPTPPPVPVTAPAPVVALPPAPTPVAAPAPMTPPTPVTAPLPTPVAPSLPQSDVTQIQQKLDTQTEENEKRLEAMDRAIYRLSKKMEQVQDSMGQIGNDMGNINQSLSVLTKEIKKVGEPEHSEHKSEIAKTEAFANPTMTVHAIIPGRAWLRDKNGRTITVTEGDMLDQYGKVLMIDAPNGVVVTSSGTTLR